MNLYFMYLKYKGPEGVKWILVAQNGTTTIRAATAVRGGESCCDVVGRHRFGGPSFFHFMVK
jgi:hypothetical protein